MTAKVLPSDTNYNFAEYGYMYAGMEICMKYIPERKAKNINDTKKYLWKAERKLDLAINEIYKMLHG